MWMLLSGAQGRQEDLWGNAFRDAHNAACLLSLLMLSHCPNKIDQLVLSTRPYLDPWLSQLSRFEVAFVVSDRLPVADDAPAVSVDLHLISNSCSPLKFVGS